jgi:hypothetical protein
MADIPQWAEERAREEYARALRPGAVTYDCIAFWEFAFARYIAEHEDPPVDPIAEAVFEALLMNGKHIDGDKLIARIRAQLQARGLKIVEAQP